MGVCDCDTERGKGEKERAYVCVWHMSLGTDGGSLPTHCRETVSWSGHEELRNGTTRKTCQLT